MSSRFKIIIAGAGGIGRAAALMLRELGDFESDIFIGDAVELTAAEAAHWVRDGSRSQSGEISSFALPRGAEGSVIDTVMKGADILLDCLPGEFSTQMARLASKYKLHYANMTEHVRETDEILKIADGAETGFILQTGLAPGFIDILGNWLYIQFCRQYGVEKVDTVSLKVGALPQSSFPPHFYGFTWSRIGVATEYIKPAVVIRDFKKCTRPSLTERATVIIKGVTYEEALTSGGAADLPVALEGKTRNLDYKTLRYPHHYAWIEDILASTPDGEDRVAYLDKKIEESIPFVEDDVVVIFASVQGKDSAGFLRLIEKSYFIEPVMIGNHRLRAIQAATAAPMAESARMLLRGRFSGAVLQSRIDPLEFMKGLFVKTVYRQ